MWFHTWWHLSPLILIPAATKLQTPDATTRGVPVMEWSVWALGPVTVPTWMSTRCVKTALNLDIHQSSQHTGTVFVSVPYSSLCMMSPQHLPELLEEFFFYRLYTSALLFLGFRGHFWHSCSALNCHLLLWEAFSLCTIMSCPSQGKFFWRTLCTSCKKYFWSIHPVNLPDKLCHS